MHLRIHAVSVLAGWRLGRLQKSSHPRSISEVALQQFPPNRFLGIAVWGVRPKLTPSTSTCQNKIRKFGGRVFQSTGSNDIQKNATFQIFKVMLWKRERGVQAGKIRKF